MKVRSYYLKIIVLFVFFLAIWTTLSAKDYGIKIYGTYTVNGGQASGVQLRLLRNGVKESAIVSNSGKFEYALQFNNQYELEFSKVGYITKKVVISTDVPERVLETNSNFPPFKIEIELFREVEGGDYSIFDEPVAMVIYDKELDDFDYDRAYNAEIEERIKEVETEIVNAPVVRKEDEKLRLYKELIKKADREFEVKSYVDSRRSYEKALEIKPKESYPEIRIGLIDDILQHMKKKEAEKKQSDSYYAFVDKADVLFEEKKHTQARSYYVKASEIKPEQQYPKDQIRLIDQIAAERAAEQKKYDNTVALADRYFKEEQYKYAQKEYEKALKMRKEETYPRQQIERIGRLLAELQNKEEKENNYKTIIAKADEFFQQKNWFDAKDAYLEATTIFPNKKYPKERIKAIQKIVAADNKELAQYTKAIKRADELFEQEEWENARKYYERALKVKPQEFYPQEQIKKLNLALANREAQEAKERAYVKEIAKGKRAFDRESWKEAREAYFAALKAKPQEEFPQQQLKIIAEKLADLANKKAEEDRYNEELKQADMHYDQEQWNEALVRYKAALEMKPSEKYPKKQLAKIERFLREELKRKTAEELEQNYQKYITEGDQAFRDENWDIALTKYRASLQLRANASYPKSQIKAIDERIEKIAEAKELQKNYESLIVKADALFSDSKWTSAITAYENAVAVKADEDYPKMRIKEARERISAEELVKLEAEEAKNLRERRKAYDETLLAADKQLAAKQYGLAKHSYRKALSILSNEQYPQKKLKEIEALLKQKERTHYRVYKRLVNLGTEKKRYYQRIVPKEVEKVHYVQRIDVAQTQEVRSSHLIRKAEEAERAGKYVFAKAYYQQAFLENPSLQILNKLQELNRRLRVKK